MTSEPEVAYVWIWLPGADTPVVCGRLDPLAQAIGFTYAASYLARADSVPVYGPELPLTTGTHLPASEQATGVPLCIHDAMPDSWGRRLVHHRLGELTGEFGDLTYLLESGSDRIGALDFQRSPTEYVPRDTDHPTLEQLARAAELLETGRPIPPELEPALLHGTSIGGARPKALLTDGARRLIAKFSSTTDTYPVVQGEFVAMSLARRAGIDVAEVSLAKAAGRWALLVERFDRSTTGTRRRVVSALTILGLTPFPEGRYASYADLTHRIRADFVDAEGTLRELFARIAFNMLCGNSDDHGRNHAAFITDDEMLALTPAYDLCPQARSGASAYDLAMAYGEDGRREARLASLVDTAHLYLLDRPEAEDVVAHLVESIREHWTEVCDLAHLTTVERDAFWGRQFMNPAVLS